MTTTLCQPARRHQVYGARDTLRTCPGVVAVDVLPPGADPTGKWTVEATVDADGIPAQVTGVVAEYGLTLRVAQPQGAHFRLVATA